MSDLRHFIPPGHYPGRHIPYSGCQPLISGTLLSYKGSSGRNGHLGIGDRLLATSKTLEGVWEGT